MAEVVAQAAEEAVLVAAAELAVDGKIDPIQK